MIVVTHAMGFARSTAHKVHVFEGGRVIESGPPGEVFEPPKNPITKQFLSNLVCSTETMQGELNWPSVSSAPPC